MNLHVFLERYIFVTKLNLLTELSMFPFFFKYTALNAVKNFLSYSIIVVFI